MSVTRISRTLCIVLTIALGLFSLTACNSNTPGPAAATVNGVEIPEEAVTAHIESIREASDLLDEPKWKSWLEEIDMTPEQLRESVLDNFIALELLRQSAASANIDINAELRSQIDDQIATHENREEWLEALEQSGYSEASYSNMIESSLLMEALLEAKVIPSTAPSEEELVDYLSTRMVGFDTAIRSSHILFDKDDSVLAEDVLSKINDGELTFAEAVEQYSIDTDSVSTGGDIGWDVIEPLYQEYIDALDELRVNQLSGLVTTNDGIHIIMVTETFTVPESITSTNQVPAEFLDIAIAYYSAIHGEENYSIWLAEVKEKADIVINPMPEDVSYNIVADTTQDNS